MGTKQLSELAVLEADWDGYGAPPLGRKAIETAGAIQFVPMSNGGVQVELHAGGAEIEIEIEPDGTVCLVTTCKAGGTPDEWVSWEMPTERM